MTIQEKYSILRPQINNGDIILVRGHSLLAKAIQWSDSAYWNHALVVFKVGDRLLAIQSLAKGVQPSFLSVELFANDDFSILRPLFSQSRIDDCVNAAFDKASSGIPYDVWSLPKILFYKKMGLKSKIMNNYPHREICSVFAFEQYGGLLPLDCYFKILKDQGFITPQDGLRYIDPAELKIINI